MNDKVWLMWESLSDDYRAEINCLIETLIAAQ